MKPMPASVTQRLTCCGERSIFTPSAASTSAAPERDESARLPCLATGTPAPATMKDAQVDTFTEPEPSPPVPTTSIASRGAFTFSILARMADTAPVISSMVSPRTRSAIRSPPNCDGVASPDIIRSKADAASSRDSVAPVATLAMIDLRSSIRCFQENAKRSVVAACSGRLREGGFVDAGADLRLDLGDVLRQQFVDLRALNVFLQSLDLIGSKIDRRRRDVDDAEHDPAVCRRVGRLSGSILGRAERSRDDAGIEAGQGRVAFEILDSFDAQPGLRRLVGELAAVVEFLDHFGRLVAQPARDLIGPPSGFDLILDLVQVAFVRGGDSENVVPDITAVVGNRVVVDADVAVEGLRDDVEPARNVLCRLTLGRTARTIHGVKGHGFQAKLLRGVDHAGPATALVLHLVAQLADLGARPRARDIVLDLRGVA